MRKRRLKRSNPVLFILSVQTPDLPDCSEGSRILYQTNLGQDIASVLKYQGFNSPFLLLNIDTVFSTDDVNDSLGRNTLILIKLILYSSLYQSWFRCGTILQRQITAFLNWSTSILTSTRYMLILLMINQYHVDSSAV